MARSSRVPEETPPRAETRGRFKLCTVCNRMRCRAGLHEKHAPCEVTLVFDNPADREHFMGQLTDGFGENEADVRPTQRGVYHVKPFAMYPEVQP